MRHPFAMTAKPLVAYQKTYRTSISRWDFGDKLCVIFIYPSSSLYACSQNRFYTNRVPTQINPNSTLNRMYSIYSGMSNILNTKIRLGWNEVTVSITKWELITPRQHEDNVYIYRYTESSLKGFSFSNML